MFSFKNTSLLLHLRLLYALLQRFRAPRMDFRPDFSLTSPGLRCSNIRWDLGVTSRTPWIRWNYEWPGQEAACEALSTAPLSRLCCCSLTCSARPCSLWIAPWWELCVNVKQKISTLSHSTLDELKIQKEGGEPQAVTIMTETFPVAFLFIPKISSRLFIFVQAVLRSTLSFLQNQSEAGLRPNVSGTGVVVTHCQVNLHWQCCCDEEGRHGVTCKAGIGKTGRAGMTHLPAQSNYVWLNQADIVLNWSGSQ